MAATPGNRRRTAATSASRRSAATALPSCFRQQDIHVLLDDYARTWGVLALLVDPDGRPMPPDGRPAPEAFVCTTAISEALRWGEPAFVPAAGERLAWAVPVMVNARIVGGLVAVAPESTLAGDRQRSRAILNDLRARAEAANLTNAALLGRNRQLGLREQARAEAIRLAKGGSARAEVHAAYQREEAGLISAIRRGDDAQARQILNRVLVVLYGLAGTDVRALKAFALELTTTMVRTAVEGGAPTRASAAGLARLAELADLEDEEAVSRWLAAAMNDLMAAIRASRSPPGDVLMTEAQRIVRERHREPLTRDQVAKQCHCSPAHFSRLFRARTGLSFTDALAQARCEHAAELLARSDDSLAGIAVDCGFADQSHFGKVFRRRMGTTPRAYRLRMQAG